jgi:hypothetical protein
MLPGAIMLPQGMMLPQAEGRTAPKDHKAVIHFSHSACG